MLKIFRILLIILLASFLVWSYSSSIKEKKIETAPVKTTVVETVVETASEEKPVENQAIPQNLESPAIVPSKPAIAPLKAESATNIDIAEIRISDLEKILQTSPHPILIDVRTSQEYSAGHVPGALLFPLESLDPEALIEKFNLKDQTFYLICRSGRRSKDAAILFKEAGAQNPVNVTGGTNAWIDANLPIVEERK